ncbi:leucine-tRNA ligase [Kockovaella imperatae]|uniref:leucine--tRNA ligase n=1 Tax=Kockovaella imperatae TaxID=4999 RepID=A0A1Y1U608_9TREE|nr:leucine-tRNA ligase [Kockovaella imperatae]ORX33463.1 leucine-tRNA ligase [Kockovaella imperatae]
MAAQVQHDAPAGSVVIMEKTGKRDYLIDIAKEAQASWQSQHVFETDPAPLPEGISSYAEFFAKGKSMEEVHEQHPKWFGTFPYAYMNGQLHMGHAFTISKIEFAAGFERMRGKRVLFPLGYHVTGMPIKAAADKLIREMEMFGEDFSGYKPEEDPAADKPASSSKPAESSDPSKGKKGKLTAKSTGLTYQFQILELSGVKREEIPKFADTQYWLKYFPPIAKDDLSVLGARIDWRRQFLTTDANPYYDSFVRWQMNRLHDQGKIKFGLRYTIYSPKDCQPCMDHDRSSGEAVNPQEYTAVKMEVLEWGPKAKSEMLQAIGGKKVWLVAATLRPETMYGQTNCFVGPTLDYGLYEAGSDLFLITDRAARNMAFQGTFGGERGEYKKVVDVKGEEVIGTKVRPPFGLVEEVYVLPMEGVLATKGTGVVTSVPSDSPDDYRTLMDLRKKADMYKIKPEWAAVDPIPVLSTPKYGDMAAEVLCKELKIQSQRDTKLLADAKELAYKEGFYNGVMTVGDFKGESVQDAKPKVRQQMIDAGVAVPYAEPESEVISRSSDVCVVALIDQWYLDYGEEKWRAQASKALAQMNTYSAETRNGFEGVLNWLNQWACARSFGLGTRLPWDPQFLVESLSDSTIYMAFYTVADLLQKDMWGREPGPLGVTAEQMTDEMWDYVFGSAPFPSGSNVPEEKAAQLKYHFNYFYPLDVRSSAKDLIPNHLTFWIYNHTALFPEKHWPRAVRSNGHLMLNGKKMSKSTGNFMTMREAIEKYGADATRLSLADAGDEITDANFEETVANAAILRLHTAATWAEEMKEASVSLRTGEYNQFDRDFEVEMNDLVGQTYQSFDRMEYKAALKTGLYDLEIARNWYRGVCNPENGGPGMHKDLVFEFIRNAALMIAPFTPHYSEHIWHNVLSETSSIQTAQFPKWTPVDPKSVAQLDYMRSIVDNMRSAEATLLKRNKKGSPMLYDPNKPKAVRFYVASEFPEWQTQCVEILRRAWNGKEFDDVKIREELAKVGLAQDKKDKKTMPFVQAFKRKVAQSGESAFDRNLPFSEYDVIVLLKPYIQGNLKLAELDVISTKDALARVEKEGESESLSRERIESAEPGTPGMQFWNV